MKNLMAAGALALTVGACVTPYTPIPYDRSMADVQTILVVDEVMPEEANTQKLATNGQNMASAMASSAGLAGVLIGAVAAGVEAGIENGQRDRMREALATQNFDGAAVFEVALEAALVEQGYVVGRVEADRPSAVKFIEFKADPDAEPSTAILDITSTSYGYQLVGGEYDVAPLCPGGYSFGESIRPRGCFDG